MMNMKTNSMKGGGQAYIPPFTEIVTVTMQQHILSYTINDVTVEDEDWE